MVSKRKKKYTSGEGARFMSRKAALKKLQLSIKDFRRLCIIKGIYPREPRNRKRAQKGASGIKTLYHTKDIQFLMHEPIIWKLREIKVYYRRIQKAKSLYDPKSVKRYMRNFPDINIDHIVKERYPTFTDALRDLDDCLTLCFLFSTFPSIKHVPRDRSILCRRLTVEFMHALIASQAIRKVFVSIKGYYFQAEIKGQLVSWIVPHFLGFQPHTKDEVDFKLMATFVEFYITLLGFVNFRLFHSLNLQYPPTLPLTGVEADKDLIDEEALASERVAALNCSLSLQNPEAVNEEVTIDEFPTDEDPEKLQEMRQEAESVKKLKSLFKGLKFFINREVPREPLVLLLRSFGADVSWDHVLFVGSTFKEDDETITHHIVDRPSMDKQYISRYYIQPQWVFDCVNARALLPVNKYLMGAVLPPHLSPFIDKAKDQIYIPPEARIEPGKRFQESDDEKSDVELASDEDENEGDESTDKTLEDEQNELEKAYNEEVENDSDSVEENSDSDDSDASADDKTTKKEKKKNMSVKPGTIEPEIPYTKERQDKQDYRLLEKMVKKKHRKLYRSMMDGKKKRMKEIWLLRKKRRLHDEQEKQEKSVTKKTVKKAVKA